MVGSITGCPVGNSSKKFAAQFVIYSSSWKYLSHFCIVYSQIKISTHFRIKIYVHIFKWKYLHVFNLEYLHIFKYRKMKHSECCWELMFVESSNQANLKMLWAQMISFLVWTTLTNYFCYQQSAIASKQWSSILIYDSSKKRW